MSDIGRKVPGASGDGPASCPALDVNTALNQGADKSTSSNPAPDDMTASNQPTDNTTASYPLMDVTPLSHEPTDVTTAGAQLADMEMIADSRSDNVSGENEHPDFFLLPLLTWLKILLFLNQRDRLMLSVTCRKLHALCRDSSILWRSIFIEMEDDDPNEEVVRMKTEDRSVLRTHYYQIQKLVIHMKCFLSMLMEESSSRVLSEAATKCQLKHLEVITDFGKDVSGDLKSEQLHYFLHTFATSPNASQLCQLKIKGFDWFTHGKSGVIETLKNSFFTSSLTHLYLEVPLDHPNEICQTIDRFQNLQCLTVPLKYLSNSLLNKFSKHLKEVHFIVHRCDRPKDVTNWPQVLTRLPQLTLGLIFVGNPAMQIIASMQCYLPISFIKSDDMFSMCDYIQFIFLELVSSSCVHLKVLQCRYHELLGTEKYQCPHHRPYGRLEGVLIKIVSLCPRLDHLDYSGSISSEAVLNLAAMRKWKVLEFYAASIICSDIHDREKKLQALCEEVSRILGRTWRLR